MNKILWPEGSPEKAVARVDVGLIGDFFRAAGWGLQGKRTCRANDTGEPPIVQARRCEAVMRRFKA